MHSHQYDFTTENFSPMYVGHEGYTFHVNGDPLPGDCLVNPRGEGWQRDWPTFRTTMEEIATYVLAESLYAVPENGLELKTTRFKKNHNSVIMTAIKIKETDDAEEMWIGHDFLKRFVDDMIEQQFVYYMEDQRNPAKMAAMGAYLLLTR